MRVIIPLGWVTAKEDRKAFLPQFVIRRRPFTKAYNVNHDLTLILTLIILILRGLVSLGVYTAEES